MESKTEVHSPGTNPAARDTEHLRGPCASTLRARDIMSTNVATAAPEDSISTIAQLMAQRSVSCVVVARQERVLGIFTEKDILHTIASGGTELYQVAVAERMSSPVDTIPIDLSILEADRIMEARCIRRLPVVGAGRLVGIVTQTDITRALTSLNSLGAVSEIMNKHIAGIPIEATVREAARMMSCGDLSCLAVTRAGKIAGVVTQKDLLKRVLAPQKDPKEALVMDVMSLPVVTIPSSCSILDASKKMESMHLHRLLVTQGEEICGVVTQADIMRAVRRSAEMVESHQRALEEELASLVQRTILDLQRVRDFLGGISARAVRADVPPQVETGAGDEMVCRTYPLPEEP